LVILDLALMGQDGDTNGKRDAMDHSSRWDVSGFLQVKKS